MKKILTILAAALFCTSAFAQFTVEAGYNNSRIYSKVLGEKSTQMLNGFQVGIDYSLSLGASDFSLNPGVYFDVLKGITAKVGNTKTTLTETYFQMPLYLTYDFYVLNDVTGYVFAGPSFSVGIQSREKAMAGKEITSVVKRYDENSDPLKNPYEYNRCDLLLGCGIGFKIMDQFRLRFGWDMGIIDRFGIDLDKTSRHRGQSYIGVGYSF